MRVDFYQLSRDPAELVVPLLARASKKAGAKLLVVSNSSEQLSLIDEKLWETAPEAFLAHGIAGGDVDAKQPILLSKELDAVNGASFLVLADGHWREPGDAFERVFYIFGPDTIDEARQTWRALGDRDEIERRFWKQDGGRWVEGP